MRQVAGEAFARAGLFARTEAEPAGMELAPGELGVCLTEDGEGCALCDARGALSDGEQQLLMAWTLLGLGERTLLLPNQATRAAQTLAAARGARVEYVSGEGALWMNAMAQRFPVQFALQCDGLQAALAMLSALTEAGLTLRAWLQDMPAVCRRSRSVAVPPSQAGRVLRAMARREQHVEFGGGMRLSRRDGWAWICPDQNKPRLRIVAESPSAEYARELCDFCERELKRIAGEKGAASK
jgi:phosphomannomutase